VLPAYLISGGLQGLGIAGAHRHPASLCGEGRGGRPADSLA
jgi:hypothetical protein